MTVGKIQKSKVGYVPSYTTGVYLSGIIILILSAITLVVFLRLPYEAYIVYPDIMVEYLLGGLMGVILSLLFLLVQRKVIYFLFLAFLIMQLIGKVFVLHWAYTLSGRVGGVATGIGLPLLLIIYLAAKYRFIFIPREEIVMASQ